MMRAGLFGGDWEDYLDALNEAFDRHAAENWPVSPFEAGPDASLSGLNQKNDGIIDARYSYKGPETLQQIARASYTASDVHNTVNQANQLAADIYARYAPGKAPPSAAQQSSDQVKIKLMQDRLTRMKYSDLPQLKLAGPSLSDNIMSASNYLYQATMNAHLGSVSNIPPAAGAALFGFDDGVLPPDALAPPQRIGHID